jgi:hypothetical protein
MKQKYSRFRELWAVPKYKLLIKLGMWFVFFLIIYVLAGITSITNKNQEAISNPSTINFSQMKQNLINNDLSVKYTINDYYIEGNIKSNVFVGTLETNDGTYKIKYDGLKLYQVKKELLNETTLLNDINITYLLPKNILNIINNINDVKKSSDNKIYSYNNNNSTISVYLTDTAITKIIILENNITYELEYEKLAN